MLVYGDREHWEEPAQIRAEIARVLTACAGLPLGLARHSLLVEAFIRTGELAQGLMDAACEKRGADDLNAAQLSGNRLLRSFGEALCNSWDEKISIPPDWESLLPALRGPETIRTKRPEGYAFYALYPESYVEAARRSGLGSDTMVIGIRSIGTSLAGVVAAALGAAPAVTLRPVGHPFQRELRIAEALERHIVGTGTRNYAIVDEGPGLSGSSFGCVADWLEARDIRPEHIHFFPSHGGDPGPEAQPRHRQRWSQSARHVVDFDAMFLGRPGRLEGWIGELVRSPVTLSDISGGQWRRRIDPRLPADSARERRKFIARSSGGSWLVKFAGLGAEGRMKFEKAQYLAEAGFSPPPIGLCHGFIVQPWVEGTPLGLAHIERKRLLAQLGDYLGFRAARLPASGAGASLGELFSMARYNLTEALGETPATQICAALGKAGDYAPYPVDIDGRLHGWEWLILQDGSLLKTDALDHSAAHDLVGFQDIAWDIAGAATEYALTLDETAQLGERVGGITGRPVAPRLVAAMRICYPAFQLGLWSFAAASAAEADRPAIETLCGRYGRYLEMLSNHGELAPAETGARTG